MQIKEIGEFGLIGRIADACRGQVPAGIVGIGDDCAVIPDRGRVSDALVSTDMLVEGDHFLLEDVDPWQLGWKSAAVNVSDIAAMGGRPAGCFLSVAFPSRLELRWVDRFMEGFLEICNKYGCPLLGGDTTSSPDRICINVTVIGYVSHGAAKLRSAALPGDLVCVTGPLGDAAGGLKVILDHVVRGADEAELVRRHYEPVPQVSAGLVLGASPSVHAMMDISDGIGSDLHHILDASGVGAEIDVRRIPLSDELLRVCSAHGWDALDFAISGGEDYQLLFTASPDFELPSGVSAIGTVTERSGGLCWLGAGKAYTGFHHF